MDIINEEEEETDSAASEGSDNGEEYLFPNPQEIEAARPPEVGMTFPSLEAAHRFLNVFAHIKGFVVVKGRNHR